MNKYSRCMITETARIPFPRLAAWAGIQVVALQIFIQPVIAAVPTYVFARSSTSLSIGERTVAKVSGSDCLKVLKRDGDWLWVESKKARTEVLATESQGVTGWIQVSAVHSLPDTIAFVDELASKKNIVELWDMLGYCHMLTGTVEGERKAISCFTRSIQLAPADPGPFFYRGACWSYLGLYDKAISDFDEAMRLAPKPKGEGFTLALSIAKRMQEIRDGEPYDFNGLPSFQKLSDAADRHDAKVGALSIFGRELGDVLSEIESQKNKDKQSSPASDAESSEVSPK